MSMCILALVIRHAKRMRHIILSSVASPALQYFPTLSYKRRGFRKTVIEQKMCVLIFYTNLSETLHILRRTKRDTITNVHRSSCKVPVILARF